MPYVRLEVNRPCAIAMDEFQRILSETVHETKGDPVSVISTVVLADVPVSFGGDSKTPAAILTLTNALMPPDVAHRVVPAVTKLISDNFGVPPQRTYLFLHQYTAPYLMGWNGQTFDVLRKLTGLCEYDQLDLINTSARQTARGDLSDIEAYLKVFTSDAVFKLNVGSQTVVTATGIEQIRQTVQRIQKERERPIKILGSTPQIEPTSGDTAIVRTEIVAYANIPNEPPRLWDSGWYLERWKKTDPGSQASSPSGDWRLLEHIEQR
ncbi:MAG TPA: phenylpyruvate tautomerase MIF-related protein [Polyangiaceae bacterium]|nr:phenylpyruvate tautomerase MIF-related protein [Polyangiaceae bacterium]